MKRWHRTMAAALAAAWTLAGGAGAQAEVGTEGPWRLSLADAVQMALENNLDLAVGRIEPERARESVVIAQSAFDPSFSAGVTWNEQQQEPRSSVSPESQTVKAVTLTYTDPLSTGGQWSAQLSHGEFSQTFPVIGNVQIPAVPSSFSTSLTLSMQHSLLRNLGLSVNKTSIEQARNSLKISEEQFRDLVIRTVQQVENAYWDLVGTRKQLEVAQSSLDLAKDFLEQTKIRVEVGTLPPIDITQAKAEVASRVQDVIAAENRVRDAEDVLRALLRVPEDSENWQREILPTDEPGFSPAPVDAEAAIRTALDRRFEVIQARLALRNEELGERFYRNQLKPDLRINGDYTVTGNNFEFVPRIIDGNVVVVTEVGGRSDSFSELQDFDNTNWTVSLNFVLPVGNRRARADHARARMAVEQARLRLEAARQQIRVEVRQAVRSVETAARQVQAARANLELQREKLEAEQKRYENGLSTAYQVLQFQNDLRVAESQEIAAIIDYNKALTDLERAQATLLEARGIELP
ncbi:MAG: TolC family protein [Acidobacteria bacterium]|nr:MAG: TolC family protein [Acidobacteriota bacterium]